MLRNICNVIVTEKMSLPSDPGLQRRLAYGDLIRRRHTQLDQPTRTLTTRGQFLQNYEDLVNLADVRVGTKLRDIVEQTHLHICVEKMLCVICQDETSPMFDVVRRLRCQHTYHAKCIDTWLVESQKCPLCNLSISTVFKTREPNVSRI